MSTSDSGSTRKRLPINPSEENLRKQAKRLAKIEPALSLQQAQHKLATQYGCKHWDELMHVVETMGRGAGQTSNVKYEMEPLPAAANKNDIQTVRQILRDGPFTQHDLDLALGRSFHKPEIAQLLLEHGADPNGQYGSNYGPIVLVAGECLDPVMLQILIDNGADVTWPPIDSKYGKTSPMITTLGTYARGTNERKHRCIDILLKNGAKIPEEITGPMFAIHRGDATELDRLIDQNPTIVNQTFPNMPYGNICLEGATLLHLAVEFDELECVDLLISRGANINAKAEVINGIGGQTAIFHAIAANPGTLPHLVEKYGNQIDVSIPGTFKFYGKKQSIPVSPLEYAEQLMVMNDPDWRKGSQKEVDLLRSIAR